MNARRFELVDDKSAKFWEITQQGAEYTVCFGKIGTKGQAKTKTLASQDAAISEVAKLIKEKTGKGYVEVGAGSSPDIEVEIITPSNEKVVSSTKTKDTKSIRKVDAASKGLTDEDIAKIRKLIDSKSLKNLEMAIHLLESVEAKPMDWSKAFNKNRLDNLCETKNIKIYTLLANSFQSDEKLMDKFVDCASKSYVANMRSEQYSEPEPEDWDEEEDGDWTRTGSGVWEEVSNNFLETLILNKDESLHLFNQKLTKHLNNSEEAEDLYLDNITELNNSIAELLINLDKWDISLNGLISISDSDAKLLSTCTITSLNGLKKISEVAAYNLTMHKHYEIELNGLNQITDKTVEALGEYPQILALDGLTNLSDEAADALSQKNWYAKAFRLSLKGLKTITDNTAVSLSKVKSEIYLDGLESISDVVSEALSRHEGGLSLRGLKSISDAAAEHFSTHNGWISFNDFPESLTNKVNRFRKRKKSQKPKHS
jgi:predicted DNA-binding WGR domain protein